MVRAGGEEAGRPAGQSGRTLELKSAEDEDEFVFSRNQNGCGTLRSGFSAPENWGVWTVDPCARLEIPAPPGQPRSIQLQFRSYARRHTPGAGFNLIINGTKIATFEGEPSSWGEVYEREFNIPEHVEPGQTLNVELEVLNGSSPNERPPSDPRLIGIGLQRIRLRTL